MDTPHAQGEWEIRGKTVLIEEKYTLLLQTLGHLRVQFKAIRDLKKGKRGRHALKR